MAQQVGFFARHSQVRVKYDVGVGRGRRRDNRGRIGGLLVGRDSRRIIITAVAIVVAIVSVRRSPPRRETPAATEMPIAAEVAARCGKPLTRKAPAESPARTAEIADPTTPL